jgi:DNA-directed RNA polymerase subunit RPC12/RpoP
MEHALRKWICIHCHRANKTVVSLDGTVNCAQCGEKVSIQPRRDYLFSFSALHPEMPPVTSKFTPAQC